MQNWEVILKIKLKEKFGDSVSISFRWASNIDGLIFTVSDDTKKVDNMISGLEEMQAGNSLHNWEVMLDSHVDTVWRQWNNLQ